ncbi:D-ribose pyranase [Aerococcaceae bacterium DSM 111020]|nr:D-ribose pyranase [Aerococcaceae bacterium DSM 111020]
MKKNGILNSEISKVLADMGHTDQLTIGDCGLPIPEETKKIDLALKLGTPNFIDVFNCIVEDMKIEKIILAEEIKELNTELYQQLIDNAEKEDWDVEFVSHQQFKEKTRNSKVIIRTGECTPFANIILQSDVIF